MRIFGLEIKRAEKALHAVSDWRGGWHRIQEPFTGAWQRNCEEKQADLLCYPALYACLSRIAGDIAKLPFQLQERKANGIWEALDNPAYSPVLRKPNHYQTQQQFREAWILSKLIHGNAYILKRRDARNVVDRLYVLDPTRVMPMVADGGDVFYQLNYPDSANLLPANYPAKQLTIPASEIIHDRLNCFHHQLIGVPPLCAAHWPAVMGMKILKTSAEFFSNAAQPAGILTGPAGMSEPDANALREFWNGRVPGNIEVIGADLKFTSFAMKSADAQLIEQLRYTAEEICQPFGIKPYKIGVGTVPGGWKADDVNVEYYGDTLSPLIEAMENLLDEGLNVSMPLGIGLDTEPLWRMDEGKLAEVETKLVQGMVKKPDESRRRMNLAPTPGGDTLWGQHQDYPLGMLAERDDLNPVAPESVPAMPAPEEEETANEEVTRALAELATRKAIDAAREAMR